MSLRIAKKNVLGKKLGYGSFGEIFEGKELKTGRRVAIKLELARAKHPQLQYEYRLYNALAGGAGIPAVHWFGKEGDYKVLVMDRLGKSLEQLFTQCGRKFSLKTTLMLADQMLARMDVISVNCPHTPATFHLLLGSYSGARERQTSRNLCRRRRDAATEGRQRRAGQHAARRW